MTKPESLSPEQQLAAIIEAQARGGFIVFQETDIKNIFEVIDANDRREMAAANGAVVSILLDPAGLRAVYGESPWGHDFTDRVTKGGRRTPRWEYIGQEIAIQWFQKPEGDPLAAIQTAFNLLPPS